MNSWMTKQGVVETLNKLFTRAVMKRHIGELFMSSHSLTDSFLVSIGQGRLNQQQQPLRRTRKVKLKLQKINK